MICYRDMTFCPFYKECKAGSTCLRAFTPAVSAAAEKWGGKNAPVCLFTERPDCFEGVAQL